MKSTTSFRLSLDNSREWRDFKCLSGLLWNPLWFNIPHLEDEQKHESMALFYQKQSCQSMNPSVLQCFNNLSTSCSLSWAVWGLYGPSWLSTAWRSSSCWPGGGPAYGPCVPPPSTPPLTKEVKGQGNSTLGQHVKFSKPWSALRRHVKLLVFTFLLLTSRWCIWDWDKTKYSVYRLWVWACVWPGLRIGQVQPRAVHDSG